MIDCALPTRDSYGNRLRGLDRIGRRCTAHFRDCKQESELAMGMIALWTRATMKNIDAYLADMDDFLETLPSA